MKRILYLSCRAKSKASAEEEVSGHRKDHMSHGADVGTNPCTGRSPRQSPSSTMTMIANAAMPSMAWRMRWMCDVAITVPRSDQK